MGALPAFDKSNRSIPALVTSDGNVLSCFWQAQKATNPDFKLFTVATGNDNARLAVDWAVALATGGKTPASKQFEAPVFEDSVSGQPHPVTCDKQPPGRRLPVRSDARRRPGEAPEIAAVVGAGALSRRPRRRCP